MSTPIPTDRVLEKIKALYEKAKNTQEIGNLEEAETFFAKVDELLKKYQLEIADVDNFTSESELKEEVVQSGYKEGIEYGHKPNEGLWERDLIVVLAEHNFCKAIFRTGRILPKGNFKGHFPKATIIGTRSNIEIVKYFFEVAKEIIFSLAAKDYDKQKQEKRLLYTVFASSRNEACQLFKMEHGLRGVFVEDVIPESYAYNMADKYQTYFLKSPSKFNIMPERGVYVRSFLLGAVNGLDDKLREEARKLKADVEVGNKMTALVKLSDKAIQEFVKIHYPKLGSFSSQSAGSSSGYNNGYTTGRNLNLRKGVDGKVTTTKELKG